MSSSTKRGRWAATGHYLPIDCVSTLTAYLGRGTSAFHLASLLVRPLPESIEAASFPLFRWTLFPSSSFSVPSAAKTEADSLVSTEDSQAKGVHALGGSFGLLFLACLSLSPALSLFYQRMDVSLPRAEPKIGGGEQDGVLYMR